MLLVNLFDLEKIHFIVSRKKFLSLAKLCLTIVVTKKIFRSTIIYKRFCISFKNVLNSCYSSTKKDYHYHFSSEEKKHTRSYILNDNKFTVYFYNYLIFLKKNQVVAKWKKNHAWKHQHSWSLQKLFTPYHQVLLKAK